MQLLLRSACGYPRRIDLLVSSPPLFTRDSLLNARSGNYRPQLLHTRLRELGSSDAKKCVKRARLSREAEVQKIDPRDENIELSGQF